MLDNQILILVHPLTTIEHYSNYVEQRYVFEATWHHSQGDESLMPSNHLRRCLGNQIYLQSGGRGTERKAKGKKEPIKDRNRILALHLSKKIE